MSCKTAYKLCDPLPNCIETLTIVTDQISVEVDVIIMDKFNNKYITTETTDVDGKIELDLTDDTIYPEILLNPFGGIYTLSIEVEGVIVPFVINATSYDAIRFEIANTFPVVSEYTLDVYAEITPEGNGWVNEGWVESGWVE